LVTVMVAPDTTAPDVSATVLDAGVVLRVDSHRQAQDGDGRQSGLRNMDLTRLEMIVFHGGTSL
jgi:hypothetical protein